MDRQTDRRLSQSPPCIPSLRTTRILSLPRAQLLCTRKVGVGGFLQVKDSGFSQDRTGAEDLGPPPDSKVISQ